MNLTGCRAWKISKMKTSQPSMLESMSKRKASPANRLPRRNLSSLAAISAVAVMVAASLTLAAYQPAFANDEPRSDVDKLEVKFFRHMYQKDTTVARLDRLEKMVFGETKSGSEQERISGLLKLVSEDDLNQSATAYSKASSKASGSSGDADASSGTSSPADETADNGGGANQSASKPKSSAPAASEPNDADYPAVSAIEKKLFGHDFHEENVEARLARLEKKVFKQVSSSNDLSERMDNLK